MDCFSWMKFLSFICLCQLRGSQPEGTIFDDLNDLEVFSSDDPVINSAMSPDVTGVLGKEVRLACHITNLGNKTISWIRHQDINLLTVGRYTYTSDQRFSAYHVPMTHFWQLRIRNVSHSDAGRYECQVSTTPPSGKIINLDVVEPVTEVLGGPDMHVDRGSTINLTCVSRFSPKPPPDVVWYHNEKEINYDSKRGGVSVVTEKGESTTSHLLIQRAANSDSGVYTCQPIDTVKAAINVHILRGKIPDAWQTGSQPNLSPICWPIAVFTLTLSTLLH